MRSRTWVEHLYLALGILDLAVATLITFGVAFSSYSLSFKLAFFVDLPIAIGLIAYVIPRFSLLIFTIAGCTATLIYIIRYTYWSMKYGNPPLPFHIAWICLSLAVAAL